LFLKEYYVFDQNKMFRWPLAIMVILSFFTLAACKAKDNKVAATGSLPASKTTVVTTPLATQAPTTEPYVLEGAITTKSGLQYLEIITGVGAVPETGNIVKMNYIVSLPDGTVIYTTYTSDNPEKVVWGRTELLPGWEEGVGMMKAGGKAKLVLPPELALGAEGAGNVPPNSQLIMEIELVSVELAPVPASVAPGELLVMENGEQYADLVLGDGAEAISNTSVTTEYSIWVAGSSSDDFVFSSADSQPVTFVVGKGDVVFPGWEQGVIGMKVGGKRLLIIPPDLGLGAESSSSIPANSTLIMEITLTDVKEPRKATKVDEKDYITAPSGLKYYDIQVGTGVTPTVGQTVVVNYVGWLEDGTQFDSSYDRGETFSFALGMGNVINGWDLGVASMKVGGIRQLVIPSELGYGDTGAGSTIPPGATLIFEVELVEIKP
jgi:peptidylprolyl isomerase